MLATIAFLPVAPRRRFAAALAVAPRRRFAAALTAFRLIALGCALAGCSAASARRSEQFGRGVLVGRVRLAPGERMPEYSASDLQRAPMHSDAGAAPVGCVAANERARHPVTLAADGLLAGIVVAASDFTHARFGKRAKPVHHRLVIRDCRLEPALIAARDGDWLEVENQDDFAFSPLLGPAFRAEPLAKGKPLKIPIVGGRVDSMLCTPQAPCGRSDVVSFRHPVFAVTDASGHFRIPRFPDSELVRVTAWHPLFEASETFAWVEPGKSAALELVIRPKARFLPVTSTAR